MAYKQLLTDKQRRLIDAYSDYPPEERAELLADVDESSVKHRLRAERTDPARVARIVREFVHDLERIERYYTDVESDYSARHRIATELEIEGVYFRLRDILDRWEKRADGPMLPGDLPDALDHLMEGIEEIDREDRLSEYDGRIGAVFWILRRDKPQEIVELLRFIRDTSAVAQQSNESQEKLKTNSANGGTWGQYAGRWLGPGEHGLVEEHPRSGNRKAYQLTERGDKVLSTIEALCESGVVENRAYIDEVSTYRAAENILQRYS